MTHLMSKIFFIDLNWPTCYCVAPSIKGAIYEYWQNNFCSNHGILTDVRIPKMCRTLSRRSQNIELFVSRSILEHGLCSANISRKFTRHRSMLTFHEFQTLSYGHPWKDLKEHTSRRQRESGLAYLRRLRTNLDSSSTKIISQRSFCSRSREYCICARCNNYRLMFVSFPLGTLSKNQRSGQASHAFRSSRAYPDVYRDYRRKDSRCRCSRHPRLRSWSILHYGSRISRLRTSICYASSSRKFCNQNKMQYAISPTLFSPGQKINRLALRSNNPFYRCRFGHKLSRTASAYTICRYRKEQSVRFSDQQFRNRRHYRGSTLQRTLENRTLFQMDQTTPAHKSIFWNITKRRQDTSLDCNLNLCPRGYYQKTSWLNAEPLHNFTNFKRYDIRENAYFSSTYRN